MNGAPWLSRFVDVYQGLNKTNLETLADIYHSEVVFSDPLHRVEGLTALTQYFANLYENVTSISFDITNVKHCDNDAFLYWRMTFSHHKLNGGSAILVDGHSHLVQLNGLVVNHRDYFDVGSMLYEQIPVLGAVIRHIKRGAGK